MYNFGFCNVSIMPVRAAPSDAAEMVSQLLFGEFFELLKPTTKPNWVLIKCIHDNYEGFVDPKQLTFLKEENFNRLEQQEPKINPETFKTIVFKNRSLKAPQGSDLRCLDEPKIEKNRTDLDFAKSYLGAPYLWGGRSPFGIDCSGLTQVIFGFRKINIPRDASQQVGLGKKIKFGNHQIWDLMFFANDKNNIIHVGIILGKNTLLHAHGEVKTSKITPEGVLNDNNTELTHYYHSIKRIV